MKYTARLLESGKYAACTTVKVVGPARVTKLEAQEDAALETFLYHQKQSFDAWKALTKLSILEEDNGDIVTITRGAINKADFFC